jgi:hypothetical protein
MNARKEWTYRDAKNQNWVFRGYEEPDDIVIMIIYGDKASRSQAPFNVVRFDESPSVHPGFHSHLNSHAVYESLGDATSKEKKIEQAFAKMCDYISQGLVMYDGHVLELNSSVEDTLNNIKKDMLSGAIESNTIQGTATISGLARIIQSEPDKV